MRYWTSIRVGPASFRIGSAWPQTIALLDTLYRDYPRSDVPNFTVRLGPTRPWRRWLRPSIAIDGDFTLPEAAPLPLAQGLLAAEMGMNLQMALGWRRHLLLHASSVERGGRALLMTGESGAGKSTLASLLGTRGWRFMGDEFALVDPATGLAHAFPRLVSLKNEAIGAVTGERWGPLLAGTPKGNIRHLVPPVGAIAAMDRSAIPAAIIFPRYGEAAARRAVDPSEAFVRLTQASTNYQALGEAGFACLTRLVREVPAIAIDYPDGESAVAMIEEFAA